MKKHQGHEKTVVEQNDEIETQPALRIAVAEIGELRTEW